MFYEEFKKYNWNQVSDRIYSVTENEVESVLSKEKIELKDFPVLLSPAAETILEQMAVLSNSKTLKRFGKTIQLYIPLYVSNFCENQCVYCGFQSGNKIKRKVLTDDEILKEIDVIKSYGYEHLLIVSGEATKKVDVNYFENVIKLAKQKFAQISIEVQPLETEEYKQLINAGLNTVYIYQETYNEEKYNVYHLKGKKSNFQYRLHTPDRLGNAGIHKIGLGTLIGLEDWRVDAFFTAMHLKYLQKKYWQTKYSISFPRLRPHTGSFNPNYPITDKQLVQLICAYRLLDEEVELSISVRESAKFRDNIIKLGITSMSAGSKTDPGGYSLKSGSLEQFEVHDNRTPNEIVNMLKSNGYEAIWKDWDLTLQK